MDVRKNSGPETTLESSATTDNPNSSSNGTSSAALLNAFSLIGAFSNVLFSLTDREAIRIHVAGSVKRLLGVEAAHVFFSAAESAEDSVRRVFETGESQIRNRFEGDAEIVVAVRGSTGTLAVIRIAERMDWTPFTVADVSVLESIAIQVGLRLENIRLSGELVRHQASSVQALAAAIEVKDRYTSGHTKRVGAYADAIVTYLPIIDTEKEKIRLAGVLHDIGKIGVPDRILLKPGSLTDAEWDEMRLHTEAGFDIVSQVAGLEEIAEILRHHHERWDGTGYPRGLRGSEIPFPSRVIAVADTFDAIVTDRPYRAAMAPAEAREIILAHAGSHFDPVVVVAFDAAFADLEASALAGRTP
jgi:HD-GYP domain-containing protein (c-di-GMP phosphodiesterase class II)